MKKLLFVIFLFLITNLSFISDFSHKEKEQTAILSFEIVRPEPIKFIVTKIKRIPEIHLYSKNDTTYTKVLNSIKKFEGLRLTSYRCPANQKTIGYGHYVAETDNVKDTITIQQADSLLTNDFSHYINYVAEKLDGLSIENKNAKILALAHFAYNVGVGTLEKSNILTLVKNNEPIDTTLLKYVHYMDKNNKFVKSDYLKQIRQYEIDLFNSVV